MTSVCPGCYLEFPSVNKFANYPLGAQNTPLPTPPISFDVGVQVDGNLIDSTLKICNEVDAILVVKDPPSEAGIGREEFQDIRDNLKNRKVRGGLDVIRGPVWIPKRK